VRILSIDDDEFVTRAIKRTLDRLDYQVDTANCVTNAARLITDNEYDLVLTDLNMPDGDGLDVIRQVREFWPFTEVIVISGHGTIARAVESTKAGAFYFLEKPVDPDQLEILVEKAIERRSLVTESINLRAQLKERTQYLDIVGSGRAMQVIFETIENIAETDANVLIIGESGTGKELIANAIHYNSNRAKRPFIKVNCAALPRELIESELFGHTKGAFTGAQGDKRGLIESAGGGSLLLDEIGEMPIEVQPKLLRVLQDKRYRRIGTDREVEVDFRLICSTNRNPIEAIESGHLREDLYYRINTVMIEVPPLRERQEDIQQLIDHFLRRYAEKYKKSISGVSSDAYERIFEYSWPGNVRELQNVIERAVLLAKGPLITLDQLAITKVSQREEPQRVNVEEYENLTLDEVEREIVRKALERTGGNKQAAAQLLGIYRPRIYNLMKKHKIPDFGKE